MSNGDYTPADPAVIAALQGIEAATVAIEASQSAIQAAQATIAAAQTAIETATQGIETATQGVEVAVQSIAQSQAARTAAIQAWLSSRWFRLNGNVYGAAGLRAVPGPNSPIRGGDDSQAQVSVPSGVRRS